MARRTPVVLLPSCDIFFFFNDTATTEIYTLSLHDALPIYCRLREGSAHDANHRHSRHSRSEEHTSELQSPCNLVCRLLLEKKKNDVATTLAVAGAREWMRASWAGMAE